MRLLVAAIAFGVTIGGLFLFDTTGTQKKSENTENYAQIIKELSNQQSKTPMPKPINKSGKIATKMPIPSATPSFSATPATSLPLASPTPPTTPTSAPTLMPTVAPSFIPTSTPTPTPNPSEQSNQISIISISPTPPIKQNSTVKLEIKTASEAQCSIKVTLPSGSQSSAGGLEAKTADNSGAVTWSWKINWNTKPGTAIIEINCSKDSQNFSKTLQMEIIERKFLDT